VLSKNYTKNFDTIKEAKKNLQNKMKIAHENVKGKENIRRGVGGRHQFIFNVC
jgi:hypothetical protein